MNKTYTIRDLASEFGITTRTLRFYEEKGLLKPSRSKQTRLYSSADRTCLRLILRGKRLGLTLEESADIIGMYDPNTSNRSQLQKLIDKIREKQSVLKQQQKDLSLMLKDLGSAEQRCVEAIDRGDR